MSQPDVRTVHGTVVVAGQDRSRADVLAAARKHLIEVEGRHHLDVDDSLVDRHGLVVRAWWGGDAVGFVQEHHDGAQPVTVVNVPTSHGPEVDSV